MGLEGELRVGLRVRDARTDRIGITSTRPDVARALLQMIKEGKLDLPGVLK